MNVQEYLKNRLENCSKYVPTEEDRKVIQFEGIEKYIYRKLKSKKFRKTSIDPDSEKQIQNAISLRVKENLPIKFNYPFGAYKIWRLPSHPYADWSEIFAITHVIEYLAPIATMYEPGIEFTFSCDDVVIELIDNYPRKELDQYSESLELIVERFKQNLPVNFKIGIKHIVPDIYTKEEYNKELNELYELRKKEGYDDKQRAAMIQKMELHFRNQGAKDYGVLDEGEKMKLWEDLTYYSDAYLKLTKRRAFVRAEDAIVLFSKKIPNAIDIGSTKASKSSFWIGTGVLEKNGDSFIEKILTPKQYELTKRDAELVEISLFDLISLKSVPVYKNRLNFLNN